MQWRHWPRVVLAMIDCIHGNPVRKKLIAKAEDWKWLSAGWQEGRRPDAVDFGGFAGLVGGKE